MCGVMYAFRRDKQPVNRSLLKRYKNQRTRGTKGFGFIAVQDGKVCEIERFEKEDDAEKAILLTQESEILFHHRLPTSTPNLKDMTHPIVVKNKELASNYYVIHNGVIRNPDTLRTIHEVLGYKYTTVMEEINITKTRSGKQEVSVESFNDSEAFAIELARFIEGKSKHIDATGTIAFIAYETDKKNNILRVHYGRNDGNPLVIEENGDLFFIKSEGNGVKVPEDMLFTIDYKTKELSSREVEIGSTGYAKSHTVAMGFNRDDDNLSAGEWWKRNHVPPALPPSKANGAVVSPIQRQNLESGWGEDDFPMSGLPTIDFDESIERDETAVDRMRVFYDSVLEEIACLESDIRMCQSYLEGGYVQDEDNIYDEEYLAECKYSLSTKQKQAERLEAYLVGLP